mmetsp:Transcript_2591/g.2927  ORF Transcript_2591/g.2927 Transcript_2591/m.2927 type:complete len:898 (-) Transcript_2591:593-3286(-)
MEINAPYRSFSNGHIERYNRTQRLMATKMMETYHVPTKFFPYALLHSTYIYNLTPQKSDGKSPNQRHGTSRDAFLPGPFGSRTYYQLKQTKEQTPGTPAIFLGQSTKHNFGTAVLARIADWKIVHSAFISVDPNYGWSKTPIQDMLSTTPELLANVPQPPIAQAKNPRPPTGNNIHTTTHPHHHHTNTQPLQPITCDTQSLSDSTTTPHTPTETHSTAPTDSNSLITSVIHTAENHAHIENSRTSDIIGSKPPHANQNPMTPTRRTSRKRKPRTIWDPSIAAQSPQLAKSIYSFDVTYLGDLSAKAVQTIAPTMESIHTRIKQLRTLVKRDTPEQEGHPEINSITDYHSLPPSDFKQKFTYAIQLELLTIISKHTFCVHRQDNSEEDIIGSHGIHILSTPVDVKYRRIPHKWVFTLKPDKFKARIVILGNCQPDTLQPTYAPTMRTSSDRMITAYAAHNNWPLKMFDVETAFLNADPTRTVFLHKIPEMELLNLDTSLIRSLVVLKSWYGQQEAPSNWFQTLSATMDSLGFEACPYDPCVFRRGSIIVGIHVDDAKYSGAPEELERFEYQFQQTYKVSNPTVCTRYLGMEYYYTKMGIFCYQHTAIRKILKEHCADIRMNNTSNPNTRTLEHITPKRTPLPVTLRLHDPSDEHAPKATHTPYRQLLGSLSQIALKSRPDIAYAVSFLQQYNQSFTTECLQAAHHICAYLKYTESYGLYFRFRQSSTHAKIKLQDGPPLRGHLNTGMLTDASTNQYGGYIGLHNGTPVIWSAQKHRACKSPAEIEFRQLAKAIGPTIWLSNMLKFMHMGLPDTIQLQVDNTTAIQIAQRPQGSSRKMQYLSRYFKFVHDRIPNEVRLTHIPTSCQTADILTKPLGKLKNHRFMELLLVDKEQITIHDN